ncbi:MAG: helix-turn-helix domain-containing protein [Oceanicaulis sp.]|nr:helix-turn-helix domain-containing protein [Oceanicaulis sp.]
MRDGRRARGLQKVFHQPCHAAASRPGARAGHGFGGPRQRACNAERRDRAWRPGDARPCGAPAPAHRPDRRSGNQHEGPARRHDARSDPGACQFGALARAAGRAVVTRQTIAAIEAGKHAPTLETACCIAGVFEKRLDEVFAWER